VPPATAIDPFLVDILVCPETRANVSVAPPELLKQLNAAIERGVLFTKAGDRLTDKIDGALVRQDNEVAYMVRDGIPIMLVAQQIPLRQLR
jgi:uncharacterized protein YbaR (Trm112 family)